ncbi:hypothetical protein PTKIN_Ptkin18bG0042200 [Pterospermum kingtungense]
MALRCVVELGIADALNSNPHGHNHPMTLSQIADRIFLLSLDIDGLSRVMRFLSCKEVLDVSIEMESGEVMYGLNNSSKWLLTRSESENCKKALEGMRNGKMIIVEAVVRPQADSLFDVEALRYDLKMLVMSPSGKERSEEEWNKLLKEGGFS